MPGAERYWKDCVYTIRHSDAIEAALRTGGQHTLPTGRAWKGAREDVAEAQKHGKTVPVLFARAEADSGVIAIADLVSVDVGDQDRFTFRNLRMLNRAIPKTDLKLREGRNLSANYIREYALCVTPPDLHDYEDGNSPLIHDIVDVQNDPTVEDETTRATLVNARLGQGQFRRDLVARWHSKCAVTQCGVLEILRASHIKPWRSCTNKERLDPANGILLSASIDALFDGCLISFEDDGRMIVSAQISESERKLLGLPRNLARPPDAPERSYLAHHRNLHYDREKRLAGEASSNGQEGSGR